MAATLGERNAAGDDRPVRTDGDGVADHTGQDQALSPPASWQQEDEQHDPQAGELLAVLSEVDRSASA